MCLPGSVLFRTSRTVRVAFFFLIPSAGRVVHVLLPMRVCMYGFREVVTIRRSPLATRWLTPSAPANTAAAVAAATMGDEVGGGGAFPGLTRSGGGVDAGGGDAPAVLLSTTMSVPIRPDDAVRVGSGAHDVRVAAVSPALCSNWAPTPPSPPLTCACTHAMGSTSAPATTRGWSSSTCFVWRGPHRRTRGGVPRRYGPPCRRGGCGAPARGQPLRTRSVSPRRARGGAPPAWRRCPCRRHRRRRCRRRGRRPPAAAAAVAAAVAVSARWRTNGEAAGLAAAGPHGGGAPRRCGGCRGAGGGAVATTRGGEVVATDGWPLGRSGDGGDWRAVCPRYPTLVPVGVCLAPAPSVVVGHDARTEAPSTTHPPVGHMPEATTAPIRPLPAPRSPTRSW